jgi:hypothetical protein
MKDLVLKIVYTIMLVDMGMAGIALQLWKKG